MILHGSYCVGTLSFSLRECSTFVNEVNRMGCGDNKVQVQGEHADVEMEIVVGRSDIKGRREEGGMEARREDLDLLLGVCCRLQTPTPTPTPPLASPMKNAMNIMNERTPSRKPMNVDDKRRPAPSWGERI